MSFAHLLMGFKPVILTFQVVEGRMALADWVARRLHRDPIENPIKPMVPLLRKIHGHAQKTLVFVSLAFVSTHALKPSCDAG